MSPRIAFVVTAALLSLLSGSAARSASSVLLEGTPVEGFTRPVHVVAARDGSGRLFVVEQGGLVRVVREGRALPSPFLDARPLLGSDAGERGLLGLALHPRFPENRRLFIAYTDRDRNDAVAELVAVGDGDRQHATAASARVLLTIPDPAPNHNGGHLLFGPDGKLWIGTGDGGGAGDPWRTAQDDASLLGKMLVLDVDTQGARPRVWARGLRNPWRYAFDERTGDLWIADVGQDAWEEVDLVANAIHVSGLDFGWSTMEGMACFRAADCDRRGLVLPVFTYPHNMRTGGCSITGGVVVDGAFLFGDYCTGTVWSARRDGASVRTERVASTGRNIVSFGRDERGGVWLVDHRGAIVPLVVAPSPSSPTKRP